MGPKKQKSRKQTFTKTFAVFMGICYLLGPLHWQITTMLHSLSHFIEMPVDIVSHGDKAFYGTHKHVNHSSLEVHHEHDVIDFIHSFFEAADDNESSQESPALSVELDKHLFSSRFFLKKSLPLKSGHDFFALVRENCKGYSRLVFSPPKSSTKGIVS